MLRMNAHDSATREAVKQAIDYIIPILGEQAEEGGDSDLHSSGDTPDGSRKRLIFPTAFKRLLKEEGMLSPVMVLVMQMVVRNREAFYSSRASFIPIILASLNRYGLPNQSTIDSRIHRAPAPVNTAYQAPPPRGRGGLDADGDDDAAPRPARAASSASASPANSGAVHHSHGSIDSSR